MENPRTYRNFFLQEFILHVQRCHRINATPLTLRKFAEIARRICRVWAE